jgi:hypothetical protein
VFNQTVVVTSPQYSNHLVKLLAGDWKMSASALAQTGPPINVTTGTDQALNSNATVQRVNQVLSDVYLPNKGPAGWLNPKAFAEPALGTYGNMTNGAIRGPGAFVVNIALSRQFRIREHQALEVRGEAFNLLNWTNVYNPVTGITAANFGQIVPSSPAGLGALASSINDPRIMQFALKYTF